MGAGLMLGKVSKLIFVGMLSSFVVTICSLFLLLSLQVNAKNPSITAIAPIEIVLLDIATDLR